jgi:Pentapeptide repeats (8 copies)
VVDAIRHDLYVRQAAMLATVLVAVLAAILPAGPALAGPHDVGCPDQVPNLAGKTVTSVKDLPRHLRCANLRAAVLDGLDLSQADLQHINAEGASFRHDDLSQADLDFADLRGAHFDHATLDQADLVQVDATGAFLPYASLEQADLTDARFTDADLDLASLDQTDLTRTDLRGASVWATVSVMAHGGGTRINLIQPGSVQLTWVLVIVALAFLARGVIAAARPLRWRGARRLDLLPDFKPLVPFLIATFLVGLLGKVLAPLQFMHPLLPIGIAVVLMVLACVLKGPTHRIDKVPLILQPSDPEPDDRKAAM